LWEKKKIAHNRKMNHHAWKTAAGQRVRESAVIAAIEREIIKCEIPRNACMWIAADRHFGISNGDWIQVTNLSAKAERFTLRVIQCRAPEQTKRYFRDNEKFVSLPRYKLTDPQEREVIVVEFVTSTDLIFDRTDGSFGWLKWKPCTAAPVDVRRRMAAVDSSHDPLKDFCECRMCDPTKRVYKS
jgi:hypothetical protein